MPQQHQMLEAYKQWQQQWQSYLPPGQPVTPEQWQRQLQQWLMSQQQQQQPQQEQSKASAASQPGQLQASQSLQGVGGGEDKLMDCSALCFELACRPHMEALQEVVVSRGEELGKAQHWRALGRYVVGSARALERLPKWPHQHMHHPQASGGGGALHTMRHNLTTMALQAVGAGGVLGLGISLCEQVLEVARKHGFTPEAVHHLDQALEASKKIAGGWNTVVNDGN